MVVMSAGFFVLANKVSDIEKKTTEGQNGEDQENELQEPVGPMYSLETFIVNLSDEGESRYLRVTMDLELKDKETSENIKSRLSQIRDGILMILTNKMLGDIQSSSGKNNLRKEIKNTLDGIVSEGNVKNVYFTEFVVQ